jgi:hypothetical protein
MIDLKGEPIRSHRPVLGIAIKSFKKFTRYWVRKYTDALFLRQNWFNQESVAATDLLIRHVEELEQKVDDLNRRLEQATHNSNK